jgi:DNA-binding transcriptional LysR family regulator
VKSIIGITIIDMDDIDYRALRRLDLNLLVALDALLSEGNVSRAAQRLCLGQPAASHALARLREVFADELLYRDGSGMQPTARAQVLAPRIRELLWEIQRIADADREFDPATHRGEVRIALNDPLEALLLPGLVARLHRLAPQLSLSVQPIPASQQLDQLDQGNILLAVGHFPSVREVHRRTPLYRSPFTCVFNPALLTLVEPLTMSEICRHPHIHTSYTGDAPGLIDGVLTRLGLSRRVVAQAATPLSIPFVVKQSPLLAVVPELITRLFVNHTDLRILPVPEAELTLPLASVSHRRDQANPLLHFVMTQVREAIEELFGPTPADG